MWVAEQKSPRNVKHDELRSRPRRSQIECNMKERQANARVGKTTKLVVNGRQGLGMRGDWKTRVEKK